MSTTTLSQREVFSTSREMDFFSEKELTNQTGHGIEEWPFVIVKELVDNALDACEDRDIAPVIVVTADASGISVSDNGPGIPDPALRGTLDFTKRSSSREAYVAPDRGAQGNALKTLASMPYVVEPDSGVFSVTARGTRHNIRVVCDPVSQRPQIHDETSDQAGTEIGIHWQPETDDDGDVVWPFDRLLPCFRSTFANEFRRLVEGFATFNPHCTISLNWFGESTTWVATNPEWSKWKPSKPSSPHWYGSEHLERLIAAYIVHDRDAGNESRTVGEFLKVFDGLKGSAKRKKVLTDTDTHHMRLSDLVVADGGFDGGLVESLLTAMQSHTKPVKPIRLGVIGESHFRSRLMAMGIMEDSFSYAKKLGVDDDGLPYGIETAFGWRGEDSEDNRLIHAGVNWSSAIKNPFRSFGSTGEGLEAYLRELCSGQSEPVVFCIHLAHPRVQYTDRGKTALALR